jgi:Fe-S-cluster containining protein
MKGSTQKHRPRCEALSGEIGKKVSCQIYFQRPTPCRSFQASYEEGVRRPRCDEARAMYGLRPLRRSDFLGLESSGSRDIMEVQPYVERISECD